MFGLFGGGLLQGGGFGGGAFPGAGIFGGGATPIAPAAPMLSGGPGLLSMPGAPTPTPGIAPIKNPPIAPTMMPSSPGGFTMPTESRVPQDMSLASGGPLLGPMTKQEALDYAAQVANERGIPVDYFQRTLQSEGLNPTGYGGGPNLPGDYRGGKPHSWGPGQFYYGGGIGNRFTKESAKTFGGQGLHASDPNTWRQQLDFMGNVIADEGWGQWNGAKTFGLYGREGLQNAHTAPMKSWEGTPNPMFATGPVPEPLPIEMAWDTSNAPTTMVAQAEPPTQVAQNEPGDTLFFSNDDLGDNTPRTSGTIHAGPDVQIAGLGMPSASKPTLGGAPSQGAGLGQSAGGQAQYQAPRGPDAEVARTLSNIEGIDVNMPTPLRNPGYGGYGIEGGINYGGPDSRGPIGISGESYGMPMDPEAGGIYGPAPAAGTMQYQPSQAGVGMPQRNPYRLDMSTMDGTLPPVLPGGEYGIVPYNPTGPLADPGSAVNVRDFMNDNYVRDFMKKSGGYGMDFGIAHGGPDSAPFNYPPGEPQSIGDGRSFVRNEDWNPLVAGDAPIDPGLGMSPFDVPMQPPIPGRPFLAPETAGSSFAPQRSVGNPMDFPDRNPGILASQVEAEPAQGIAPPPLPDRNTGVLPSPKTYALKKGENPWAVAKRLGIPFKKMMELNMMTDAQSRRLPIGYLLNLPGGY